MGKILLEAWSLPERLVEADQFQHSPLQASKYRVDALLIYVADIVAYDMKLGNSGEGFIPKINPEILKILSLSEDYVKSLQEYVQQEVNKTAEILIN